MPKALIFSPYLNTHGGGEVYTLNFARCLQKSGYNLSIAWDNPEDLTLFNSKFDLSPAPQIDRQAYKLFTTSNSILSKWKHFRTFDLIFFLSDGSLPFLFAKKNFVHFQVPFTHLKLSLINQLKLRSIHQIIVNSHFTAKVIDSRLSLKSQVIPPPLQFDLTTKSHHKEPIILSVGRFTTSLHHKRQDVLVDTFKTLCDQGLKGWRLVLAGSNQEDSGLLESLQQNSHDYPIDIYSDISTSSLSKLYSQASIFWLATGFGVNPTTHPHQVEHFGIVVAEAMAAAAVPIVINFGGPAQIVTPDHDGFHFSSQKELKDLTLKLINDPSLLSKLSKNAVKSAQKYTKAKFCSRVNALL